VRKAATQSLFKPVIYLTTALLLSANLLAQQMADPEFNSSVERPAYSRKHPKVIIDEAHSNFHTADGRYKPFADLLRNDGYQVVPGTNKFKKESLEGAKVLVIANAAAPDASDDTSAPAFTQEECDAVRVWVRAGGSLLLIADHAPFGSAAENLARQFGVEMGKGYVFDLANSDRSPTTLVFSQENGLLGNHPLLRGRNPSEQVKRVVAFTGQSLSVPEGAIALMRLGPGAHESPNRRELQAAVEMASSRSAISADHARAAGGRAQGVAMKFGRGRVVILGEAAMFSAQVIRSTQAGQTRESRMGMNVPGNDDKQFALNVLRWLSGLLN
jgi:hypothetical protein